ncbi:unnamed protein product [Lupinus luteus]|uniref:Gnk2-homologous domain-containing protein n=1 Tax=Lupinus luteus TaxID=3873 RepID=A0AAV1VS03_LUPLU
MGMNVITKHYSQTFLFLFILYVFFLHSISNADNTNLIFKGCAEKKLQDPSGICTKNLKSLLISLVSQSRQKPFYTTTSGENKNMIMGLYQCKGDLSNSSCYNCISKIDDMLDKLCGKVVAARVHLCGCYLRYEVVGFKQVPETHLLYKVCGSKQESEDNDNGIVEKRDMAFDMIESGVKNGGKLFYSGSYKSLNVLGQCDGDLASDDCGDCVKSAEDQAKTECGDSLSAQIYLNKCYISYNFKSNEMPKKSSFPGTALQQHTQKTIALVVGGFAALGFFAVCVLFLKSVLKKKDDMQ